MALLEDSIANLAVILKKYRDPWEYDKRDDWSRLREKSRSFRGSSKKGNVERLIDQMNSNKKLLYHYLSFLLNEKVTSIKLPSLEVAVPFSFK